MVAQRLSADFRWLVTGTPSYFETFGEPLHPNDLKSHRCLRFRLGDDTVYRWEFDKDGEDIVIDVPGPIVLNESQCIRSLMQAGVGLIYAPEPLVASLVDAGAARYVLEDWPSPGPGFHIYYSSRRQLPAGLRLLIDLIREMRPLGL